MPDQVVNFPRDTTMSRMADAQEKTNEILAAIAAGSAGGGVHRHGFRRAAGRQQHHRHFLAVVASVGWGGRDQV